MKRARLITDKIRQDALNLITKCVMWSWRGNLINSTCTLVTRKIIIANKQQINSCLYKEDLEIFNSFNNTIRKKLIKENHKLHSILGNPHQALEMAYQKWHY